MSAARWAKRQALLAKSGEGFPSTPPARCGPRTRSRSSTATRRSFRIHPELDGLLRTHGIDTLLITGVATSTCCESTARDASMWGYRTIMVSDGNADQTDTLHNHTLGKFLVTFGDVQATDEVAKLGWGVRSRRTAGIPQPAGSRHGP